MEPKKTNNLVAKHSYQKGGYHKNRKDQSRRVRGAKHKGKQ